jgi:hypothetical protein
MSIRVPLDPMNALWAITGSCMTELLQGSTHLRDWKDAPWVMEHWLAWIGDHAGVEVRRARIIRDPNMVENSTSDRMAFSHEPDEATETR